MQEHNAQGRFSMDRVIGYFEFPGEAGLKDKRKILKKIVAGLLGLLYAVILTMIAFGFDGASLFNGFEDLLFQQGQAASENILVIGLTEEDLNYYFDSPAVILAKVAQTLNEKATPRTVTLDVPLSGLDETALEILQSAAQKDNLILPLEFDLPEGLFIDSYGAYTKDLSAVSVSRANHDLSFNATLGHTVRVYDKGGVMRHAVLNMELDGTVYKSLPYVTYEEYCNATGQYLSYPRTNSDNVAVKFVDRETFNTTRCLSVHDFYLFLQTNADAAEFLSNKMVFLGYMNSSMDKGFVTAVDHDNIMYSVEYDAQIASALFTDNTATIIPQWIQAVGFLIASVLLFVVVADRSGWIGVCFAFIYILMNRVVTMALFGMGYMAYSVPHYVTAVLTVLTAGILTYVYNLSKRRVATERILKYYVGSSIATSINSDDERFKGAENVKDSTTTSTKLTILFADIRGFTSFSESLAPEELVPVLNLYLRMMAKCIEDYDGTVDKFIGDCVMAYWGAPKEDPEGAIKACLAARAMQRGCKNLTYDLRKKAEQEHREPYRAIEIGIGINTGQAVVGEIGSDERKNFTALGDAVNTSQRMESVAPGGSIYISEAVLNEIRNQAEPEVEELPEKMTFKGKSEPQTVYSLKGLRQNSKKREERKQGSVYQNRAFAGILINIVLLISNALYILNTISMNGMNFVHHYSILMACLACIASATSLPFLVTSARNANGLSIQPKIVDILRISALVGGLYTMVTFLGILIPKVGWDSALSGEYWPGGIWYNIICPILYCVLFFVCETKRPYKAAEVFFAEIPLLIARFIGLYLSSTIADGFVDVTGSREVFYLFPGVALSIIGELLAIILVLSVNEIVRKHDADFVNRNRIVYTLINSVQKTKLYQKLQEERYKGLILLAIDLGMMASCLKGIITSLITRTELLFNFVSLLLIGIAVCTLVIMIYNGNAVLKNKEDKDQAFYRYASFCRQFLWGLEFAVSVFFAARQGSVGAFVAEDLGGDIMISLIWPLISFVIFISEKNEYKLPFVLLETIIPIAFFFISQQALQGLAGSLGPLEKYQTYYSTAEMILLPLVILLLAVVLFYLNAVFKRMFDKRNSTAVFTVCGTRSDNQRMAAALSQYGNSSECYVLRDREYAMVINAGSGIVNARQALYGCSNVDFIVTTDNPDMRLGFMYMEELCQYAKCRVISPFGGAEFVDCNAWNKKLKKKQNWIHIEDNEPTKLTDDYSVEMIPMETDRSKRMLKISGRTELFFAPSMEEDYSQLQIYAGDADYLICDELKDYQKACYLAIDCQIPNVLISGFSTSTNDKTIATAEADAKKILEGVRFAREEVFASR